GPVRAGRGAREGAEAMVCAGRRGDRTETPEDYRATILYGVNKGLKLLCANPDIVVDVGDKRIYCAGAIAQAYTEAGGESFYFGKPHAPIYALARRWLEAAGYDGGPRASLGVGDGIDTDIAGAIGEELDTVFVTGGLAAAVTGTSGDAGPDANLLDTYLKKALLTPSVVIPY